MTKVIINEKEIFIYDVNEYDMQNGQSKKIYIDCEDDRISIIVEQLDAFINALKECAENLD